MTTSSTTELCPSKYRLLGLVGQGQFGRVYCASQRKTGALVALKELDRQRFSTQKFLRELRFLLALQHPNIVICRALEHTQTSRYLVMDYCEAGTLRNLLDEEVRLHPLQGLKLLTQVLQGLEHAHQRGIVHCDIKPENILLTAIADGWVARVSDFGIARLSQEMFSDEFSNTGSPAYMAPERFYGQYSPASDLYAVGILLYELLVGRRPFFGAPVELMTAHINHPAQIPETVPAAIKAVITTALQKLPGRRYRSAAEMLENLETAIAQSEQELNSGWNPSTLLRPGQPPASVPFQFVEQEKLASPMQQLVGCDRSLRSLFTPLPNASFPSQEVELAAFRVAGRTISYQTFVPADFSSLSSTQTSGSSATCLSSTHFAFDLREPVLDLVLRPQGCFVVTEKGGYFLAAEWLERQVKQEPGRSQESGVRSQEETGGGRQETAVGSQESGGRVAGGSNGIASMLQLVVELPQKAQVVIDPAGRWIAAVVPQPNQLGSQLKLWNFKPSTPFRPAIACAITSCFQILAIDSRHLVSFSHVTDGEACITGVRLEGFTRRGTSFGTLQLPIPLHQVSLTATPYRLLALEPQHPDSVSILDLKPLRLQRIGLTIAPKYLVSTAWGYLLMAADGQIVLLNGYGQLIGRIDGPPHPTAIAALSPYEFAIATWHQDQSFLYRIDLRQLDLDVVF